ncbi:DUF2790 domain-containing protein [Pseudomonas sp. sp1636]|uniref:DUF2790 domain-containing protein n=1 Tax=Pseudomonas sp. sp1636 TaxID=3036707 RepID=UPI0025A4E44A|nr:DUF2790 domain-containing protein [Pseudomonas sp. sp1636]MDM8349489.1 DUF2790 domain-containing protein [Pseudomonas sp. sp1636]
MKSTIRIAGLFAAITLVSAGGLAHAGQTQLIQDVSRDAPSRLEQTPVETYHYGMKLDIARVLSISDTSQVCDVVPSVMHYEDREGKLRALEYLIHGGGCLDN